MHSGTHVNAPRHLIQRGAGVGEIPMERFFGSGVVLSIPKGRVAVGDCRRSRSAPLPHIEPEDIVVIVTGWHRRYSDSIEYFGHSPGLSARGRAMVGRQGREPRRRRHAAGRPSARHFAWAPSQRTADEAAAPKGMRRATGGSATGGFPDWNPAHRALLAAGIPDDRERRRRCRRTRWASDARSRPIRGTGTRATLARCDSRRYSTPPAPIGSSRVFPENDELAMSIKNGDGG